ncbi:immunoglobulin superfamily member 1-like [Sminthopsis crassicaudata]|uniref:immunoglobulin superfamily member 1-like n=1 Tax=Sminthopsis crassicaudata TaxID=9301 RepID=UPI003D689CB1
MDATVTFLISIGLCLHWEVEAQLATISRPTLWAEPSPVVPKGADVTLRCQGQRGRKRFQLWKDEELQEERNVSWHLADFVLRNVDDFNDARSYRCRSGQGPLWSEFSDPLALVVMTGDFPKPSILVLPNFSGSPRTTWTIQCQISWQSSSDHNFALLEAKSLQVLQLQKFSRGQIYFSLPLVRAEDSGNYSCIYYRKTPPYRGSQPSHTLELIVSDKLPRPTLRAQPGPVVPPGTNITLWCLRPKMSSLEEVTFTLWEIRSHLPLQNQISAALWTDFSLPSVRPEDTGSYRCTYKDRTASGIKSEYSNSLELVVTGSLPKPSLSALPGQVVEPGKHVTLQCRQPSWSALWRATFTLLKVGSPQPLQSQSPAGTFAVFPLLSVRAQDAGNYTCIYQETAFHQGSEPSDNIEIWVTDAPPKPSLSVWPAPEIASGTNVTLLCQGPPWTTRFVLHKEGSMDITQDEAEFFLTRVTSKHSGHYSCSYQLGTNGSLWAQHSDPLQLTVRESSKTLLITLSCVTFLLLCLLLLVCFCHQYIPRAAGFPGDSFRRFFCCSCLPQDVCLSHHLEDPREDPLYTEVGTERPKESSMPIDKDVTYAHLNKKTLNERQTGSKETTTEATLYTTLSLEMLGPDTFMEITFLSSSETLTRPTFWALPSPVVPKGANVTLRCQGRPGSDRFQLWKDGELREERNGPWSQADFVLRNANDWTDARSYRCRSGKGPLWSELSEPLALVVTGVFPKPNIEISADALISPGKTVTIWCQMPQRSSTEEYTFALLDAKSLEPLMLQISAGPRADFLIPSVRAKDTGSYSCIYYKKTPPHRASHLSPAVELTVLGQLPRPALWAQPGLVVAPGTNITLWCLRPRLASPKDVTFSLWKTGTQEPLQNQTSAALWTDFSLSSVRPKDTGSYRCTYKDRTASGREPESSEALELVVTGSLPKPSLSALPDLMVEPGKHVTLQCRQPPQSALWRATFTLLKVGSPQPLQSQSPAGTSADFPLLSVKAQDAGNYTCVYYERMAPYQVSEPSDALEIWVTGSGTSDTIIIRLSSMLLLLCLLLMSFLWYP